MGILAAGFLGGLSNASKNLAFTDERQTANTIAEHQLEYVKGLSYAASYTADPFTTTAYPGYTVAISTANVTSRDANIQKISILVTHNGKPIKMQGNATNSTLEGYKVN